MTALAHRIMALMDVMAAALLVTASLRSSHRPRAADLARLGIADTDFTVRL